MNAKKLSLFLIPLVLMAGVFLLGHNASADFSSWAGEVVGGLIGLIISALGLILILVIKGLILIASYQNFIGSQPVILGWVIVRDVCNMFFVVILMMIAFGTILHLENYSYKKWLPKLIMMAILINFSKTICGLLIDASQVVMLTFVNAFKDVGGANMTDILGISDIVTMAKNSNDSGFLVIVGAYILGLIYIIIALIVITTMMMMLVMRLVMIWIYVVLSPLAYLLAAFPGGAKYSSQWWSEFTKNLITGPILAFFIWLSFAALQTGNTANNADLQSLTSNNSNEAVTTAAGGANTSDSSQLAQVGSKASTPGALLKFVIAIGMLIGGLKIAQEIGGAAGSLAGSGMSMINKGKGLAMGAGAGALAFAREKTVAGVKAGAQTGARMGGVALGGMDRSLGALTDKLTATLGKRKNGEPLTNFANKGLFTATVTGLKNAPGNIYTRADAYLNRNKELNDRRREYLEEQKAKGEAATLTFSGKKYKQEEKTGNFFEVDNEGKEVLSKNARGEQERTYLQTGKPGEEKKVKAMGKTAAAWRDAWYTSGSQARAAANKAQEESISKEQARISNSGQTNDELRRALMSDSTSATKKMALAMTLAMKAGFKNKKEVDLAKKYLGSNSILMGKFNDEVDSKQAHLNYDLSVKDDGKFNNDNDVNKFRSRIDAGKIDSTRLSADIFSAPKSGIVDILRDYHGPADFDRVIESNYKKNKKNSDAISKALLSNRKPVNGSLADDRNAKLHAKLTGKVQESFVINDQLDKAALGKYVSSAKAVDLNKMDVKSIDASAFGNDIKNIISENINFAKLKSIYRSDNPDLVKTVIDTAARTNPNLTDAVKKDAELSTVSPLSNLAV